MNPDLHGLTLLLALLVTPVLLGVPPVVLDQDADKPAADSAKERAFAKLRKQMVKEQLEGYGIKDEKVLGAMQRALRHRLVPVEYRRLAYHDTPLPIGSGQTISQPYIVALMTSLLDLSRDDRVLEVGTGSGYQAAVLAEIVGTVYSIEIYRPLHERSRKNLEVLGYRNISQRHGDGSLGWKAEAPFDAIIVTCAASHIPPALIEQLKPGGKMCIPVGQPFGSQRLLLVSKNDAGKVSTRTVTRVRFVPLLSPKKLRPEERPKTPKHK